MGEISGIIDVEKLISYSDDLVKVLKDKKDVNNFAQLLEQSMALQSSSDSDFYQVQSLLRDYQKKIDACKQKTDEAKSEAVADVDIDCLQKELEEELENERLLKEELRIFANKINDLDYKRISFEERLQVLKKLKQDELRAKRILSMHASVTNIIPNLDDRSKISGYIVDRDKKVVEKFEFDQNKITALDTCNDIWKTINLQ